MILDWLLTPEPSPSGMTCSVRRIPGIEYNTALKLFGSPQSLPNDPYAWQYRLATGGVVKIYMDLSNYTMNKFLDDRSIKGISTQEALDGINELSVMSSYDEFCLVSFFIRNILGIDNLMQYNKHLIAYVLK